MLKDTTYFRQPVFAQLTGMINRSAFASLVKEHDADHYCKRCKSTRPTIPKIAYFYKCRFLPDSDTYNE